MASTLWKYLRRDKASINGWFQHIDAEIIGALLLAQEAHEIRGGCVEIGVHHGKSFIPLCITLRDDEFAISIDVFGDQALNKDASGSGDLAMLRRNLAAFHIPRSKVVIIQNSSDQVSPKDILDTAGEIRFFSIDGGHWKDIVKSDLQLAESVLAKSGIIALDDYCRADWPEVTTGYALWQDQTNSTLVPFAIGSNKLYICNAAYVSIYQSAVRNHLSDYYLIKTYHGTYSNIDSYRNEPYRQDEASFRQIISFTLRSFYPSLYHLLLSIYIKMTNFKLRDKSDVQRP